MKRSLACGSWVLVLLTAGWIESKAARAAGTPTAWRTITPPGAYDLSVDGDLELGGAIFKEGYPFLHNEGGAALGNTALGIDALRYVTPGSPDTYSGISNTALGRSALRLNTSGSNNTAAGLGALTSNSTGRFNVAVGAVSLRANTSGSDNVALGAIALYSNTVGSYNTATGFQALSLNTEGSYNTATGAYALRSNTTGLGNTAGGLRALDLNSTGGGNVALGVRALAANTVGSSNTAVGYRALAANVTGSRNIAVGYAAGSLTTGDDNILLDNPGVPAESGVIRIGNVSSHYQAYAAGVLNVAITGVHPVYVNALGQLGMNTSSRRVKEAIEPMGESSSPLLELSPVAFRASDGGRRFGLIAEEVARVLPDLVELDDQGEPVTVLYHLLAPMLVNELQKLRAQGADREVWLAELSRELALQEAELETLVARLDPETDGSILVLAPVVDRRTPQTIRSATVGAGPAPRDVTPPGSYAVSISDDLSLGGYVFRDGYSLLHSDGGALYGNTAGGFLALQATTPGVPASGYGYGNTAFGYAALMSNTSGYLNTAIGLAALVSNDGGVFNTAAGYHALGGVVEDNSRNTAVGFGALDANSVGHLNTAVGYNALGGGITIGGNTLFGYGAGDDLAAGSYNVGFGRGVFNSFDDGSQNTAVGSFAQDSNASVSPSDRNTALGTFTNRRGSTNNTAIGFDASGDGPTASQSLFLAHNNRDAGNAVFLGDEGTHTRSFLAGVVNAPVAGSHAVYVDASGQLGQTTSSRRFKNEVESLSNTGSQLAELRPVMFRAREEVELGIQREHYGLIAEEVAEALPELVGYDETGRPQGVLYHLLGPLLVAEVRAVEAAQRGLSPKTAAMRETLHGLRAELLHAGERVGRLSSSNREVVDRASARDEQRERARRLRAELRARSGLLDLARPLTSPTLGRTLDAPQLGVTLEGAIELAGYLFKDGAPFLHTDRGRTERSTGLGTNALDSQIYPAVGNTALGREAMTSVTVGYYNTALGNNALLTLTVGYGNTAIGDYSAWSLTDGVYSTAVGDLTMAFATTFDGHVAVGSNALQYTYNGSRGNAANGMLTLLTNTTGSRNTAVGYAAMLNNTNGNFNVSAGFYALGTNSSGTSNTAAGAYALASNTTGSRNTAVGYRAGINLTTGDDNVAVGNEGVAGESATLRIGTAGTHTQAFVAGVVGNMITGVHGLYVDASGQLGMASSSLRAKTEVRPIGDSSLGLLELRPVTFTYKREFAAGDTRRRYGLIAEEVAEVFPDLVSVDRNGRPQGVFYRQFYPMLLNELQRERRVERWQRERLAELRRRIADLQERLRVLRAELARREEHDLTVRRAPATS